MGIHGRQKLACGWEDEPVSKAVTKYLERCETDIIHFRQHKAYVRSGQRIPFHRKCADDFRAFSAFRIFRIPSHAENVFISGASSFLWRHSHYLLIIICPFIASQPKYILFVSWECSEPQHCSVFTVQWLSVCWSAFLQHFPFRLIEYQFINLIVL